MALILAVDDDVVLTMSLDLQLGYEGHQVYRADSIAKVDAHLETIIPNVLIIDPAVDPEQCWMLITNWATRIPVIVLSHDPTDATRTKAHKLGCRNYIGKPCTIRALVDAINAVISDDTATTTTNKPKARTGRKSARTTASTPVTPTTDTGADTPANNAQADDLLSLNMNDDDELLLAGLPTTAPAVVPQHQDNTSLGSRFREARVARNIPLTQVNLAVGIQLTYLQAIEEDRFSFLPRGRMAEEMLRKYARYLNLDEAEAIQIYRGLQYSDSYEPITEFGATSLIVTSYWSILLWLIGISILTAIGYGIWRIDQPRILATMDAARQLVIPNTPTNTPTLTATSTPTATVTPSATATHTPTLTPSITLTPSETLTPSRTLAPTRTLSPTRTSSPTRTATNTPTATVTDTATVTPTATVTNTASRTATTSRTTTPVATATRRP